MPQKFSLLFFAVICVLFSQAQSLHYLNNRQQVNLSALPVLLKYENTSGEKAQTIFEFDGNNLLQKGKWERFDNGRSSLNYYLYNKKTQLIQFYREFADGLTGSINFEYNEEGNLSRETFSRSDGITGTATYHYSENGQLNLINCNNMKGWFTGEIIYNTQDDQPGQQAKIFQDGKLSGTIYFQYENGNLSTEKWEMTNGWGQTFEWKYTPKKKTYTSSNVFIAENNRFRLNLESYDFNQQQGGPSSFCYDSISGMLTEKIFTRSDSLLTSTFFEYSDDGLLTQSTRQYNDGRIGIFSYQWTPFRKMQSRTLKIDGIETSKEEYTYDETGQLISGRWNNFDGWLSGNLSFLYAPTGQISSGTFAGFDGQKATIQFSYDSNGNLSQIKWSFDSGLTQLYQFEYEQIP